ncbi:MAG: hypothetical protein CO113_09215 [Elusimicrobia bacterium CG_4_9_14_3_um_filter_62_55]|nr:MAG: hypothetical protein COR54_16975 [Elusimicrobia bacterium CG22_combo_CG10-13_8_21_14_all_63_91]PJA16684.1 MAG: hypothetical protein COX66_06870 [Elusimicrobia bacterium CG_4_10_14_0_2_um_filter_63_34]PJB25316.1 MAG: hypothetical protein CO113_09215 [Elusimicrobia bacterium CG_4_9_14_3_um_filter_62_55]
MMRRRGEEEDSGVYAIVFLLTIVLFLFVAYQGYKRYIRKAPPRRPPMTRPAQRQSSEPADGIDRAPSSLPALKTDGKRVLGGSSTR